MVRPDALRMKVETTAPAGAACLPVTRCQHASAALLDGRILTVGGWRHSGLPAYVPPLADAQIYDPRGDIWTQAAAMKTARADHAAVTLGDGRILVIGGMNRIPLATSEIYDPSSDTWKEAAPMTQALYSACGFLCRWPGRRHRWLQPGTSRKHSNLRCCRRRLALGPLITQYLLRKQSHGT